MKWYVYRRTDRSLVRYVLALSAVLLCVVLACGCGEQERAGVAQQPSVTHVYEYEVPLCRESPWPQMRRTRYGNGQSPIVAQGTGTPWRFKTGKGIFSVPVIGHDHAVLVGSADCVFYAIWPDGTLKWRFPTGEIIDSAAAVRADHTIVVPSGDGHIYALGPDGKELWRFRAHHSAGEPDEHQGTHCGPFEPQGGPSNWFEGNVIVGEQGLLWAGNDNYRMYGLSPQGEEVVAFYPGPIPFGAVWSAAAILRDGSAIFGSLDFCLYSVSARGTCNWRVSLGGPVSSSPALSDDTRIAYVGSWDGCIYAVETATGHIRWSFKTRDHVYGSPAVMADGTVLCGSTDGTMYAFTPEGNLLWTFDVGEPIRSSPALAGDGTIFFGAADGRVYALNPDGTRRWSYDTTQQDRNDLNSSPALGEGRLYIGSEDGSVIGLPYSYCDDNAMDSRCSQEPLSDLPDHGDLLYYISPGGRSFVDPPKPVQRGAVLTVRLFLRRQARTVMGSILARSLKVNSVPAAEFEIIESPRNDYVHLLPRQMLAPATDYEVTVSAAYRVAETREVGTVRRVFSFRTVDEQAPPVPLTVGSNRTRAFQIRNLAPHQPSLIVSLNQIGFDSLDLLGSVVHRAGDRWTLWLVGGKSGSQETVIDPGTPTMIAMNGTMDGNSFILEGANFRLVTGGPPMDVSRIRVASQFDSTFSFDEGTSIIAQADCPKLGPVGLFLVLFGQCNSELQLPVVGTVRGFAYDGGANQRPPDVAVAQVAMEQRRIVADLRALHYPASEHLGAIIVLDEKDGMVVPLDYRACLTTAIDAGGNLAKIVLDIPEGVVLPAEGMRVIVLTDLYPLASVVLPLPL